MSQEVRGLPSPLADVHRTLVFGVLNVTPDSFSDGGRFSDTDAATAAGMAMMAAGADVVDVGGESTRPGAQRVEVDEERRRVVPVVAALADAGVPVSIDTMRADIARECIEAGAVIVNDVSGGLADERMLPMMATTSVPYVLMHWRGHGWYMDDKAAYHDVVEDVCHELRERLHACDSAGIDRRRVIIDPGIGFAKTPEHNWALLRSMDRVQALGQPVLVGASRKRFLGALLAQGEEPRDIPGRCWPPAECGACACMMCGRTPTRSQWRRHGRR
jgi:dihydropteroate synthase